VAAWRPALPAKILVGVSGGADSLALLDALVRLGWRPHVCHLNHRWRGAASEADAAFVRQLARQRGLPVTIATLRRRNPAVPPTEAAGREARLAFFERVARKTGISTLVLAHTADDQAETVLMRLIRGAGPTGLAGIAAERRLGKLRVVRPLLEVTRAEVLQYLAAHGLKWREDATNRDRRYLRNRIRQELLPLLERDYNPGIRDVLRRTAEIFRAEAAAEPAAGERREIRRQLGALRFRQVEEIRKRWAGPWPVNLRGVTRLPQLGIRLTTDSPLRCNICYTKIGDSGAVLDAVAVGRRPFVRTWREGDRFQPLGMKGAKKLQDFFVDEKVPRQNRGRVPLVCATDGRIAWVVGYRIAEPFKVTPQTKRVLRMRLADC
jgi:tRNA(Ile)-lysidine synthase